MVAWNQPKSTTYPAVDSGSQIYTTRNTAPSIMPKSAKCLIRCVVRIMAPLYTVANAFSNPQAAEAA